MNPTSLLEIKSLRFGYGETTVLEDVNLEVKEGDFVGMIGPNGGGKSTLIKLIMGLLQPWEGSIRKKREMNIGYLPQYHQFDNKFPISVQEVIASGLLKKRRATFRIGKQERLLVDQVLERVGLTGLTHRPVGELSGGQMQRVFIGRSLISDPDLLILDEPGTYVDNRFESKLYSLLHDLNQEASIILVSHDVGQIVGYVKTIACVNGTVHYHPSNKISNEILASYNCPIELISHGHVPHRVLKTHEDD